jgi:nicotinamidase-related amidase
MRINVKDSLAVVIDIQERLFPHIYQHQKLERNCMILVSGFRELAVPLLVTEQYSKGLGQTIESVKSSLPEYNPLEKMSFSCCGNAAFMDVLKRYNRRNIILCGIEAHVCVLQTAVDLKQTGFQPILVADCTSSRRESDKHIALNRLQQEGVLMTSYESILFELCSESGTPTFKAISNLVK